MKKYLTPELLKEELYGKDVITASGEGNNSEPTPQAEVDNAIRRFSLFI